jgi:hypothetical protein
MINYFTNKCPFGSHLGPIRIHRFPSPDPLFSVVATRWRRSKTPAMEAPNGPMRKRCSTAASVANMP